MKDYYKILGVDENASTEGIRAAWAKLTKHYHPDLEKTNGGNEKINEINEAYEILKDNSKRLDYDFQRILKNSIRIKHQSKKEKRFFSKKIALSVGLMVFFLMVGFILLRSHRVPIQPKSELRYEMSKILPKKPAPPVIPPEVKEKVKVEREIRKEIHPPSLSLAEKESKRKEEVVVREAMKSEMPGKVDQEVPKEATQVTLQPGETLQSKTKEEKEVPKEISKVISQESAKMDQPRPIITEPQPAQEPEIPVKAERVVILPPPLLANEEEVKQFFLSYIDRYHRKDIDGFISFFSSKAVQNQKEGLEEIKKVYKNYFDSSQELNYRMEDTKIQIYQNSVEVKARYRVNQKLKKRGEEKIWIGNIRWVLVKEEGVLRISLLDYQNEKSP